MTLAALRGSLKVLAALVCGTLFITTFSCRHIDVEYPPETMALFKAGKIDEAYDLGVRQLTKHLGEPFPDWTLTDPQGRPVNLKQFRGKRVALFFAGSECPTTMKYIAFLDANNWKFPGYDAEQIIVGVFQIKNSLVTNMMLNDGRTVLQGRMPFPGFAGYYVAQSVVFFIGPDGVLDGFQDYPNTGLKTTLREGLR